jgi:hypothetical protein
MQAYITRFRVQNIGPGKAFPTDMLRYDSCYPATSDDVHGMDWDDRAGRTVSLLKIHNGRPRKGWETTPDRWRSFGWKIVSQATEKM